MRTALHESESTDGVNEISGARRGEEENYELSDDSDMTPGAR